MGNKRESGWYEMKRKLRMQRGGVLIMTLVFVSMFVVIFSGLTGMVSRTYHETVLQAHDELAFQVAESGLNYARWRLLMTRMTLWLKRE